MGFFMPIPDLDFMRRALTLAERGRGSTSPNPMVGAVVVKNGRIVGEGYHRAPGTDHAEIVALKRAGKAARGAVLYVTLEPCCHTGRTGPCTDAVIAYGIKAVFAAVKDPNPAVDGRGIKALRKAGITVRTGLLREQATLLNDKYFGYHRNGRPFVILKTAQTLDGRIATVSGDSRWITSAASRRFAHRLRAEVDAVAVGMGTVRSDNPALTVRHVRGQAPYRIILSQSLRFPPSCRLLTDNKDYRTIVAGGEKAIERFSRTKKGRNLILWGIRLDRQGMPQIRDFLNKAADFGLQSILVEGGSTLATAFLKAGFVDKCIVITAPILCGHGVAAVGDLGTKKLGDAIGFEHGSFEASGIDNVFIGYPKRS